MDQEEPELQLTGQKPDIMWPCPIKTESEDPETKKLEAKPSTSGTSSFVVGRFTVEKVEVRNSR